MNKLALILVCLFFPLCLIAQTATEEALERACACFGSLVVDSLSYKRLSAVADSCLEEALYTNLTGVLKENQASLDDNDAMFRVAQQLHHALLEDCQGFRQFSKALAGYQVTEVKAKNQSSTGLLYGFNTNQQFPIITILTQDLQTLDFVWFREFDGSTRFMNGIEDYQNRVVEIVWKDLELYDVVTQSYPFYKEIILIEEVQELSNKERKDWVKRYLKQLKKSSK